MREVNNTRGALNRSVGTHRSPDGAGHIGPRGFMGMVSIRRPMAVICIVFMLAVFLILEAGGGVDESGSELDGRNVTVTGTITQKVYKNEKYSLHINNVYFDSEKSGENNADNIIVYLKSQNAEDFKIGQTVYITGRYSDFDIAENEGQFNMRRYYRIRGYRCSIVGAEVTKTSRSYNRLGEFLHRQRERIRKVFYDNLPEEEAGTLSAIVLGDKSGLDADIKELYQNAGISHVLSLSGLHIATLGLSLFTLLMKAGAGAKKASFISSAIMVLYSLMTGMSTSTQRALIMFVLGLIAKNIGRTYDLLSGVCLSAIIILTESPFMIYDSGFLLSVCAVIGIGMIYPVLMDLIKPEESENTEIMSTGTRDNKLICSEADIEKTLKENQPETIEERREILINKNKNGYGVSVLQIIIRLRSRKKKRFKNKNVGISKVAADIHEKLCSGICISLSVMLATLPVTLNSFYQISLYGIVLNLVIVPLMGAVLSLGIIGGLTGYFLKYIPGMLLFAVRIILKFYKLVCENAVGLPSNTFVLGKADTWQIIVYIMLIVAVYVIYSSNIKIHIPYGNKSIVNPNENKTDIQIEIKNNFIHSDKCIGNRKITKPAEMVLIMLAALILLIRIRPEMSINVLSVGQGACNVIYGADVPTIVVDGGSSDVKDVGKYRIIPFLKSKGIREIDYLFITHPDEDHISGIKELLTDKYAGIRVRHIFMSVYDAEIESLVFGSQNISTSNDISEKTEQKEVGEGSPGIQIHYMNCGDRINKGGFTIECLNPTINSYVNNSGTNVSKNTSKNTTTNSSEDLNDSSLVLKLTHKDFTALFTGDISTQVENELIKKDGAENGTNLMTAAHHGSKYSNSEQFINYVNPTIITISSGLNNSYGHPHAETLERIESARIPYFRTDQCGQITIICNPTPYIKTLVDDTYYTY